MSFFSTQMRMVSAWPLRRTWTMTPELEQKFLRHRLIRKPVVIVGKVVIDRNMVETMWIEAPGCAKNTFSQKETR